MPGLWPIFSARWTSPTATTHATSPSMARRCERAKTATARLSMCSQRFAAACKQLSDTRPRAYKGLEIPDALKLLERLDMTGKIVTGDAIFCQKSIATKIVERGGDYLFPVKDNQKTLRRDIETAFNEPVFPPVHMG